MGSLHRSVRTQKEVLSVEPTNGQPRSSILYVNQVDWLCSYHTVSSVLQIGSVLLYIICFFPPSSRNKCVFRNGQRINALIIQKQFEKDVVVRLTDATTSAFLHCYGDIASHVNCGAPFKSPVIKYRIRSR